MKKEEIERAASKRKYRLSDKGRAQSEKMRIKYRDNEEFRNACLERSRKQAEKKMEEKRV